MREIRYILLGLSVLLAACNKEDRDPTTSYGSGQIGFEATTGDVSTKTEYSHTWTSGSSPSAGNSREFIDWIAGDVLRIYCKEADGSLDGNNPVSADPSNNYCADYRVTANTRASSSNNTRASIEPFTSNPYGNGGYAGLQWGDANTKHHLYAVYPSPGQGNAKDRDGNTVKDPSGNNLSSMPITAGWHTASSAQAVFSRINQLLGNDASRIVGSFYVKGSLPSAQQGFWSQDAGSAGDQSASNSAKRHFRPNMNYAAMVAYRRSLPKTDGSKVVLGFEPVFTALEFQIVGKKDDLLDSDLASAELSSATSDLCGEFVTTFVPVLSQNEQDVYVETGSRNDTGNGWRGPNGDRTLIYRTVCTGAATNSKKVSISFAKDSEADGHANGRRLVEYNPANPSTYNPITFTFLVLPQAYDNNHPLSGQYTNGLYTPSEVVTQLTLTLRFKNGETRSLELRYDLNNDGTVAEDEWIGVKMYKKSYFKNMQVPNDLDDWIYEIDPIDGIYFPGKEAGSKDFTISSYRYKNSDPSNKEPVAWEIEGFASDSTATEWTGVKGSNYIYNGGFTITSIAGAGGYNPASANSTASVIAQSAQTEDTELDVIRYAREKLEYNGSYGTENAPRDLSMYDLFSGKREPGKPVTANSYVVDRAGYYMFPAVYGNAIDFTIAPNGNNTQAYIPFPVLSGGVSGYRNANGPLEANSYISQPWIHSDLGESESNLEAIVLWQDLSSENVSVTDAQVILSSAVSSTGTDSGLSGPYIRFRVGKEKLYQCNAVIALRRKSNSEIVWSWHIWVTADPVSLIRVPIYRDDVLGPSFKTYNMMLNLNLGWCDGGSAKIKQFAPRMQYVKVRQVEGTATRIFKLAQSGETLTITSVYGSSPTYQWGRKDPFLPCTTSGGAFLLENKASTAYEGYTITSGIKAVPMFSSVPNNGNIVSEAIKHPYKYLNGTSLEWLCDFWPANLWSSQDSGGTRAGNHTHAADDIIIKTVFDPCPPGLCVPNGNAFTGFRDGKRNTRNGAGFNSEMRQWEFHSDYSDQNSPIICFPCSPDRLDNGQLNGTIYVGSYWQSNAYNTNGSKIVPFMQFTNANTNSYQEANATRGAMIRPVAENHMLDVYLSMGQHIVDGGTGVWE